MSMQQGQPVEVRTRFDGSWAKGYDITSAVEHGYRVRRRSDGMLLPVVLSEEDLRPDPLE